MKLLKLTLLALIIVAFSLRPQKIAEATCAGGDFDAPVAYNLFTPMSFADLTDFWRKPDPTEEANLTDWLAYLNNKPSREDVREVVYKLSIADLQKIRALVQAGKGNTPDAWKNNTLIKYWQGNKDIEAIDYLMYAKTCEMQAGTFDDWDTNQRDKNKVKALAEEITKAYKNATNDFLRLRLAYQAIRMAHYSEQYSKGITLYDELVQPLENKTNSPIRYWALAHKAGCLSGQGYEDKAGYLFAQVFDKCPSKRVSSALSWKIENETQWANALALCKTPEEQAALYFMRSLDREADILAEMTGIYAQYPAYDKLDVLLLREINQLENALLKVELKENLLFLQKTGATSTEEAAKKLRKVQTFVSKCVAEGKVKNKEVFAIASAYLDFIAGNSAQALNKLDALKTKEPAYQQQIEVCKLAIKLAGLTKTDEITESEMFESVIKTKNEVLKTFMWHVYERLYTKQAEVGKAFLCLKHGSEMLYTPNVALLDNLLALADKKKKNPIEQYLLTQVSQNNPKVVLQEIKATCLFSQDKLQEAIALYEQVPTEMIGNLEENPLAYAIQHYSTYPDIAGKNKYNRMSLAQKIVGLKKLSENPNIDQAHQYFQLGCIYYNLTFFGNAWKATDYHRSSTDLHQSYTKGEDNTYANFDCSKAKYYFERAMNVAMKDQNRELGAKSAYMAAKCEQNQFYVSPKNKDVWGLIEPTYAPEHRRYFATLQKDFANTKYYKEILQECSYFNTFIKKK